MSQVQQAIDELLELDPLTKKYIEDNLESLIGEHVIPEMQSVARAMNLPRHFVDGIKFKIVGPLHAKIFNVWGTKEKPLSKWFNDGTNDHFIAPLGDWMLKWKTPLGNTARSPGHMVRGLPKTEAMQIGIAIGMRRFKTAVLKNTKENVSKELELIE